MDMSPTAFELPEMLKQDGVIFRKLSRFLDVNAVRCLKPRSTRIDVGLHRVRAFDQLRPWIDLIYPRACKSFPRIASAEVVPEHGHSSAKYDAL